jgi:hypothetical protein
MKPGSRKRPSLAQIAYEAQPTARQREDPNTPWGETHPVTKRDWTRIAMAVAKELLSRRVDDELAPPRPNPHEIRSPEIRFPGFRSRPMKR